MITFLFLFSLCFALPWTFFDDTRDVCKRNSLLTLDVEQNTCYDGYDCDVVEVDCSKASECAAGQASPNAFFECMGCALNTNSWRWDGPETLDFFTEACEDDSSAFSLSFDEKDCNFAIMGGFIALSLQCDSFESIFDGFSPKSTSTAASIQYDFFCSKK